MKRMLPCLICMLLLTFKGWSQRPTDKDGNVIFDSSHPENAASKDGILPGILSLSPTVIFDEFPYNHNMHITSDGSYYYTINGGNSSFGQINKFDLAGTLIQTDTILIDGRGLSYNPADSFLYASLYARDIVKITNLATGSYTTVFPGIMHDDQASFALSVDGTKFYDFTSGTLYVHDFATGIITDTITGLQFGAGNFGGNAAVAVDSNFIYTWDATIKTVYVYDLLGSFVQTLVLDSGDNGHSIAIANNHLFVSRDGNYATGTWYGYFPSLVAPVVSNLACSDTNFCDKHCVDFVDLSTNSPTSWQWYFPGADSTYSTLQNPTNICYNSYGSFDVTLIACNGAGCDTLFLPGFINEYQPPPVPVISASDDTLFSTPAYAYQWYYNTSAIPGATDSFYVVTQQGGYFVIITDSNGCISSSNAVYTGMPDLNFNIHDIHILPNPSNETIEIHFYSANNQPALLTIYNTFGQLILKQENNNNPTPGEADIKMDVSKFAEGVYLLTLEQGDKTSHVKFMVRH